jgi:hypothetical protein
LGPLFGREPPPALQLPNIDRRGLPAPPLLGFVIVYTPENGDRLPAWREGLEPDSIALQQETHCRFFFSNHVIPVGRSRLKCSFEADRLPLARQGHLADGKRNCHVAVMASDQFGVSLPGLNPIAGYMVLRSVGIPLDAGCMKDPLSLAP